jgi:integrase
LAFRKWFTGTPKTVERSAQNLRQYCEWIGKNPAQLRNEYVKARKSVTRLEDWEREIRNNIAKFYNYLKEEDYAINSARTIVTGVMAFYSQNCKKILGITKLLDPVQIPENEFVFTQEILRKCYYYGSPFEKTWLSCAVALGYASKDFLLVDTEKIRQLVRESRDKNLDFIRFIGKTRQKTSIQPRSFLTPEAIENLEEYLRVLEKVHSGQLPKYLWDRATNDNLNDWLKALLRKANVETYGKQVRFHGLRKFLCDTLAKMNETVACVVTGQKTNAPPSKITYRATINSECERVYRESHKFFALNGDVTGKTKQEQTEKIAQLQATVVSLEKENHVLKTRVDVLQNGLGMTKDALADLLKSSIKEMIQEKLLEPSKTTDLGFLTIPKIPNIDAMSSDEIIKLYAKLKRGEPLSSIASPDLFESLKQKSE